MTEEIAEKVLRDLLREMGEPLRMMPLTRAELEALGIPIPADAEVIQGPLPTDAIVVCAPLTEPLIMSGNVVGSCAVCQRPIQYRPWLPKVSKRICAPCAVRQARGNA